MCVCIAEGRLSERKLQRKEKSAFAKEKGPECAKTTV